MDIFSKAALTRRGALGGLGGLALASALPGPAAYAFDRTGTIEVDGGRVEYSVKGRGPTVYMVPSFGRGCDDFDMLAATLVKTGYRVVCAQPRGVGASVNHKKDVTLDDLSNDAATVLRAVGGAPAVVLGHAFGQRVTRNLAARHPELVRSLIMLACGGKVGAAPAVVRAVEGCFDTSLSEKQHMADVRFAFFAPGNDPTPWKGGWYPAAARLQRASMRVPPKTWWAAGGKVKILVIQGLQDVAAVPENARLFKAEFPKRVELVEINHAGHALLPEQPRDVAAAVLKFLKETA